MEKKQNYLTAAMTVLAPAIKPSLVSDSLPKLKCKVQNCNYMQILVFETSLLTFPNPSNLPNLNTKTTIQSCTENHNHIGLHT